MNNYLFFLDSLTEPCENINILRVILFVKQLLGILFMIVPILLIVMLSFDMLKNVIAKDDGEQKKNLGLFIKRIISLVAIFLMPTIVSFVVNLVDDSLGGENSGYFKCISVTSDTIESLLSSNEADCTSNGGTWNSDTGICTKASSDTDKKTSVTLSSPVKAVVSSSSRFVAGSKHPSQLQYPAAEASLMMSLPSREEATGNYGTDLYVYVYDHVIEDESAYRLGKKKEAANGSTRYKSCSEAVATAVRWSGTDDSFPLSPGEQLNYVRKSSKWVQVNWNGDYSKLQPGDVFVDSGHALMYIGKELLHKYFPSSPAKYNITQASYNEDYIHKAQSVHIDYRSDLTDSRWINNAFRCVERETNSKYANVGFPR